VRCTPRRSDPDEIRLSGLRQPCSRRYSKPEANPTGPAGSENNSPLTLALKLFWSLPPWSRVVKWM